MKTRNKGIIVAFLVIGVIATIVTTTQVSANTTQVALQDVQPNELAHRWQNRQQMGLQDSKSQTAGAYNGQCNGENDSIQSRSQTRTCALNQNCLTHQIQAMVCYKDQN